MLTRTSSSRCTAVSRRSTRTPVGPALVLPAAPIVVRAAIARLLVVSHASRDGGSSQEAWMAEREEWSARERALMSELVAVRAQVDKLLDQQQMLISMLAASSASGAAAPAAAMQPSLPSNGSTLPLTGLWTPAPASPSPASLSPSPTAPPTPSAPATPSAASASSFSPSSPSAPFDLSSIPTAGGSDAMQQLFSEWGVATNQSQVDNSALAMIGEAIRQATGEAATAAAAVAGAFLQGQQQQQQPQQQQQQQQQAAGSAAAGGEDSTEISIKPAVDGQPPVLMLGEDDIYWMDRLHTALTSAGYNCGDEEMEVWEFGEMTREAVAYFQATTGLPETGVVDIATWNALFAEAPDMAEEIAGDIASGRVPNATKGGSTGSSSGTSSTSSSASGSASGSSGSAGSSNAGSGAAAAVAAAAAAATSAVAAAVTAVAAAAPSDATMQAKAAGSGGSSGSGSISSGSGSGGISAAGVSGSASGSSSAASSGGSSGTAATASQPKQLTKWPVLQEGDGGQEVRALQVALDEAGFYCGEEDMQWWMIGDSTRNALMTYQASVGLPETGVCDARTWQALLGAGSVPSDIYAVKSTDVDGDDGGSEFSIDMTDSDKGVWLLGEQRWERR